MNDNKRKQKHKKRILQNEEKITMKENEKGNTKNKHMEKSKA